MTPRNELASEAVAPKGAEQAEPGVRNLDVIPKPELVFGLVGAVGTDLKILTTLLTQQLARVGYKTSAIRLSELLKQLPAYANVYETPNDRRYHAYMTSSALNGAS